MKKIILIITFLSVSLSLFAQEPIVKFYLLDGSSKQCNIVEIENITVLTGSSKYIMNIYEKGSKISNFVTKIIESIKFETDAGNYQVLNICISGKPNSFRLLDIDSINFTITEEPLPLITSINPASGKIGDEITINGKHFGDSQGSGYVSFNGTNATACTSWSNNEIKVKVPTGATSGKLFVMVNNKKSNEVDFTLMLHNQPQIISINPTAANIGDIVAINGSNFGISQGSGFVTFNGINASDYISWSNTEIQVKVPGGVKSGKISVTADGVKSNEYYITIKPNITGITPAPAKIGDEISISGSNFGSNQDISIVSFDLIDAAEYTKWSDTLIKVKVPQGASSGIIFVTVNSNKSNEFDFTIIPQITAIEPASARIGGIITITGTSFKATQGADSVYFNSIKAIEYISWSDWEIKVKVPSGATTGKIIVMIKGVKSNEMDFTVIPKIESINPSSARIGDEIKIKGSGFGKKTGASTVSFQGADIQNFTNWLPTEIILNVPPGAETGPVTVTAGNEKSNEIDFTILPKINNVNPSNVKIGDEITINGSSFGDEQGKSTVSFNGTNASEIISWSSAQIIVKVPAGAETGKLSVTIVGQKSNEVDYKIVDLYIESISPSSAYVGDEVTISGFGFGDSRGTSKVSFKSKDASEYTSWNDKEIKVKVPNGAKTGKVYVTANGEMSNEVNFTISTNTGDNEVTIGTQIWMLKNLDVTTYRNGDQIPQVTDQTEWLNITTGAWCYFDNVESYGETYGKLYNWNAINDSRGLAPEGWHIPTKEEWETLSNYLGGENSAGGKLKETGYEHWNSPNTGATNESGFTALPGGYRGTGFPYGIGVLGLFASSTSIDINKFYGFGVKHDHGKLDLSVKMDKRCGLSVRCIKD